MNPLINCTKLLRYLSDPQWIIADCRFMLDNPDWGFQDYLRNHIPRAIYVDLNKRLSSPPRKMTGRHPLPDMVHFQDYLSEIGISPSKHIVVYDTVGGAYAARLWWMLHYLRFEQVHLLNGGFSKWLQLGYPTSTGEEFSKPTPFTPREPNSSMVVSTTEMEKIINDSSHTIIDSRSPERYRGEIEPIDPIAGHIRNAINRFHGVNLDSDMTFRKKSVLTSEFRDILKSQPQNTVFYCGSGVTSCLQVIAMEYADLPGARVYIGSWSEWIKDPTHPIISKATSSKG